MDLNDLRLAALHQAAADEKHSGGSGVVYLTPPEASKVIARAKAYVAFLAGQHSPGPVAKKKRRNK